MRERKVWILFLIIFACINFSCKKSSTSGTDVGSAVLLSFSLHHDSVPKLASGKFVINDEGDNGIIYLQDSLPFGVKIDTVFSTMTFYSTPGSVVFEYSDFDIKGRTAQVYSTGDTLFWGNSRIFPIRLTITSWNRKNTRTYIIYSMPIERVNHDLFIWSKLIDSLCPREQFEQKAFAFKNTLYFYKNNGITITGYRSLDGIRWENFNITGLVDFPRVSNIINSDDSIYWIKDNSLYLSSDGQHWDNLLVNTGGYTLISPLFYWIDTVWYVATNTMLDKLEMVSIANNKIKSSGVFLSNDFPVSNFASVTFSSSSGRPRALIYGGLNAVGENIDGGWSFEYSAYHGIRVQHVSYNDNHFSELLDAAIVWYNNTLFLFGGIMKNAKYNDAIYYSVDEGGSWLATDTANNKLPISGGGRCKQSVFLWKGDICLIGGQTETNSFSDVYIGWLNKKKYNWE